MASLPLTVWVLLPKLSSHEREVMSTLLARQTTLSAVTVIFLVMGTLLSPPRNAATAFFSLAGNGE
ncbi:hypothetical protein [Bradyrhizobium sp. USDA 4524]